MIVESMTLLLFVGSLGLVTRCCLKSICRPQDWKLLNMRGCLSMTVGQVSDLWSRDNIFTLWRMAPAHFIFIDLSRSLNLFKPMIILIIVIMLWKYLLWIFIDLVYVYRTYNILLLKSVKICLGTSSVKPRDLGVGLSQGVWCMAQPCAHT